MAHQHAQANIDKLQNNSNSNNNDNDRRHIAAQQYGTQATIVPTPNIIMLQPNSRVASAQPMATSPDQPGALLLFDLFLHTKQGAPKQKGVAIFFAFEQIDPSFLDYLPTHE